jgi:hypothetical protein
LNEPLPISGFDNKGFLLSPYSISFDYTTNSYNYDFLPDVLWPNYIYYLLPSLLYFSGYFIEISDIGEDWEVDLIIIKFFFCLGVYLI